MPIRWDKFTLKAQESVQRANDLASEHGNPELLPVHLLAALLEDREGIVPPIVEKIGIAVQAVLNEVYREIERLPKISGGGVAQATLSQPMNQLLPSRRPIILRMSTFLPSICYSPSRSSSATLPRSFWLVTAPLTRPSSKRLLRSADRSVLPTRIPKPSTRRSNAMPVISLNKHGAASSIR